MARIIEIDNLDAKELDPFVRLTGHQLRNRLEPESGIFIVESPIAIDAALKAGAWELLECLKAKDVPMTVASSTDRYLLEGAFERLDLGRFFEGIISCGELETTKSDPLIFSKAAEMIGTPPEDTWVFEDGLYAIKTAHEAGFKTVAVFDELSKEDYGEMTELADIHVNRLDEFIDNIERLD